MRFKKFYALLSAMLMAVVPALADDWFMVIDTNNGWTVDNGTVSVIYTFNKNVDYTSGWTVHHFCKPSIETKIKNNSDDFIYIDLSKTYITRNGEAELYQDIVAMQQDVSDKEDGSDKKISQSVMPIPPHASKTFTFPLFLNKSNCYDKHVIYDEYYKDFRYNNEGTAYYNDTFEYNADNSPIQSLISFAYSTAEKGEKQVKVNKDFYMVFAAAVKKVYSMGNVTKEVEELYPNYKNSSWFFLGANDKFEKAKKNKAKKDKKDKKG